MENYNVNVTNKYGFLTAKKDSLIVEVDLVLKTVTYNGINLRLNDCCNNDPDYDLMYLACALRKTIFDDVNLKVKFADSLTILRRITYSCPIPDNLKINIVSL